eukprot:c11319_g1_i2 orf=152-352(+)
MVNILMGKEKRSYGSRNGPISLQVEEANFTTHGLAKDIEGNGPIIPLDPIINEGSMSNGRGITSIV